jgi:hypothetical protein
VDNTPASITLSQTTLSIASGASALLTPTVKTKDGRPTSAAITWTSADPAIASVALGVVTGARVGSTTITATAGAATATASVTVSAGAAATLGIRTQPASGAIGSVLGAQPVIEIRDAAGNIATASTATVSATIAAGGGTLSGTTTVAATGGVATFSNLAIAGLPGPRTITFSSTGLTPVTSAEFMMAGSTSPMITVDRSTVSFATTTGVTPAIATVNVTNGGVQPIAALAVESVTYETGAGTDWLTATLSAATAPSILTLTPRITGVADGTHRATVRLAAAGATNSPVSITVTLVITTAYNVTFGTAAERVRVVDVGATFAPTLTAVDGANRPAPPSVITFRSSAASVATVAADGRITARTPGDAWIVASSVTSADSVFVIVPQSATSPVIRSTLTSYAGRIADTIYATVVLDTRGTTVGAAVAGVDISVNSTFLYNTPTGAPTPVVSLTTSNVFRIAVGSPTGMTGTVSLLNLRIVPRATGVFWIYFYALDLSGIDGSNLTPLASSTRIPIIVR